VLSSVQQHVGASTDRQQEVFWNGCGSARAAADRSNAAKAAAAPRKQNEVPVERAIAGNNTVTPAKYS
jgi:hypothetical protein